MSAMGIEGAMSCYEALCRAYAEKHRFYHTAHHIDAMLKHFDVVAGIAERPGELELAIWFHDAVYKPLSKTNELDSAKWAQEFLVSRNFDAGGAERINRLIMATSHNGVAKDNDEKLIVDIDLAILGALPDVYDEFERNVRREYRIVPSFIYRKKRKELLKSFLDNTSIYNFDYFRNRYEVAARENVIRKIKML